jgi:hypothetical protein
MHAKLKQAALMSTAVLRIEAALLKILLIFFVASGCSCYSLLPRLQRLQWLQSALALITSPTAVGCARAAALAAYKNKVVHE